MIHIVVGFCPHMADPHPFVDVLCGLPQLLYAN
jgi:hypothetical protein